MTSDQLQRQLKLLMLILPFVGRERSLALCGGAALNQFYFAQPRHSNDIDLCYLYPVSEAAAPATVAAVLRRLGAMVTDGIPGCETFWVKRNAGSISGMKIQLDYVSVKIDVGKRIFGSLYPPVRRQAPLATAGAGSTAVKLLSFEDTCAGKLVAALDRQHVRDLFDVHNILQTDAPGSCRLKEAFVVYLVSSTKWPVLRLLQPRPRQIADEEVAQFNSQVTQPVAKDDLLRARAQLLAAWVHNMPAAHRRFLLGWEAGAPDWSLLAAGSRARQLPAVRQKMRQIAAQTNSSRQQAVAKLRQFFDRHPLA